MTLREVKLDLRKRFPTDYSNDKKWLKSILNEFYGQKETSNNNEVDLNIFTEYAQHFIDNILPNKLDKRTGRLGATQNTINKYKNVRVKVLGFEKGKTDKLELTDINETFHTDFIRYLREEEQLSTNTIGRCIVYIRTIYNDAHKRGYKTSPELSDVKGFKEKVEFTYLNESEINKILLHDFSKTPYLNNAHD